MKIIEPKQWPDDKVREYLDMQFPDERIEWVKSMGSDSIDYYWNAEVTIILQAG